MNVIPAEAGIQVEKLVADTLFQERNIMAKEHIKKFIKQNWKDFSC
jgi:hypothetical protein